jgi:prepilin-type N-terminal cleavage/methylation domain-containing protein
MDLHSNLTRKIGLFSQMKSRLHRDNRGFTLVQVLVAVALILVIASIAAMAYQGLIDDARAAACENNLKVLNTAVELYADEYGVIPAVLGKLKPEHLQKAYARIMENSSSYRRFCLALLEISQSDEACAEFLSYENLKKFGAAKDSFRCPGDDNSGTSYGINANVAGTLWPKVDNHVVVIGDCDSPTFTSAAQLKKRHASGKVAIAMTKAGSVAKFGDESSGATDTADAVGPTFDVRDNALADADYNGMVSEYVTKLNGFVSGLDLPAGVESSYMAKLGNVASFVESKNITEASNELEAFIAKVGTDMSDSIITEGAGDDLIAVARNFMEELRN